MVTYYFTDKNGTIECSEFISHFFRLGRVERDRHIRKKNELTKANYDLEQERIQKVKERYGKLASAKIRPGTETDTEKAIMKLKKAAAYYSADNIFGSITKSFESSELDPTAFREALKRNFSIYLTPEELGAVIRMLK